MAIVISSTEKRGAVQMTISSATLASGFADVPIEGIFKLELKR